MDGKQGKTIDEILYRISPREQMAIATEHNMFTYSVIGFISASDFTDSGILLSNLGYLLSIDKINVCVLDFKVFYPNLYQYLDVAPNKRGKGLLSILKTDKNDIRDEINKTKYNGLYLLSPSPQDTMEEYFDFEFKNVNYVLESLKKIFDIVLVDIPNIPPLEFCVEAFKYCHRGFFLASERSDASKNMVRFLDYVSSLGIGTGKFANIIFMNLQNSEYDFGPFKDLGFNITAKLPLINKSAKDSYEGKLYMKDNPLVNKYYAEEIKKIKQIIMEQG